MKITFINIGFGEAILVENQGRFILIDGSFDPLCSYGDGTHLPPVEFLKQQGVKNLEALVMTHPHLDHAGGLYEVLKEIPVQVLWVNALPKWEFSPDRPFVFNNEPNAETRGNGATENFLQALHCFEKMLFFCKAKGIPVKELFQYQELECIGLHFTALSPLTSKQTEYRRGLTLLRETRDSSALTGLAGQLDAAGNEACLALSVRGSGKAAFSALLSSDMGYGFSSSYESAPHLLSSQLLKAPHHGHPQGVPEGFLRAVSPDLVMVCASWDRRYGCPSPLFLEEALTYFKEQPEYGAPEGRLLFTDCCAIPGFPSSYTRKKAVQIFRDTETGRLNYKYIP